MDKRADLRQYYQTEANKQLADKQYQERAVQLGRLENTVVRGFNTLIKQNTNVTKTEVVNQPKSVLTPDVDKVVQAVDSLPGKLKKQADESVQKVDVQNLDFSKLSEAITSLTKVEGKKGDKGEDGYTPVKGVDYFDGKDGRTVELRTNSTHIQYRYEGDATWTNIISTDSLKGERGYTPIKGVDYFDGKDGKDGKDAIAKDGKDGAEVELRKTAKQIQWRRKGGKWAILVKLSDLKGDTKYVGGGGGGPGIVKAVIAGAGISIDSTDVYNPIISATGGSMADPGANGMVVRTALDTTTARTITGTTNQITVTNGDGVAGNPTLALPQNIHAGAIPTFGGATLQSPTAAASTFLNVNANATGNRANITLRGYNASNSGDAFSLEMRTDFADAIAYVYDNSTATYHNMFNFSYLTDTVKMLHTVPSTDSTYTLGTSSLYWKETYTDKLFLNSTATLDGSTAGTVAITGNVTSTGTGSFTTVTAGTTTDVLGTALTVIRNNVAVGRIDNNASGLRVQAQTGTLQLRGTGNTGIAVGSTGKATFASDIEFSDTASGVILKSPDGTLYRVTVANGGTLAVAAV